MSEASRQRLLFLSNRLEELQAKHGPPEIPAPMGADLPPSWGEVGTLARRLLSPTEYARVVRDTEELNRMERAARLARGDLWETAEPPPPVQQAQPAMQQQPPQNRVPEATKPKRRHTRTADW